MKIPANALAKRLGDQAYVDWPTERRRRLLRWMCEEVLRTDASATESKNTAFQDTMNHASALEKHIRRTADQLAQTKREEREKRRRVAAEAHLNAQKLEPFILVELSMKSLHPKK